MPRLLILASSLMLAACASSDQPGSWYDAMTGMFGNDAAGPLEELVVSSGNTPANQSLLYTAMIEAEAAAQSAGRAGVLAEDKPAELEAALGELVYALEPAAAPPWDVKNTGLIPGWQGHGYGLLRVAEEMATRLRQLEGAQPPLSGQAANALICVENTLGFGREALDLGQSLLSAPGEDQLAALVPRLERLARALLNGLDADGDGEVEIREGECALQQAAWILEPLRFDAGDA